MSSSSRISGHAVTVWGYTCDTTKNQGEAGYYTGLIISDSDDDKYLSTATQAPDRLNIISLTWSASAQTYYTKYSAGNRVAKLEDFIALTPKEDWPAGAATTAVASLSDTGTGMDALLSGAMPAITWRELAAQKDGLVLIDTRTPEEFAFGTIPGAVNIPLDNLRQRLSEVPADRPVVVFCAVGLRGYLAQRILMGRGYINVRNLIGGYKTYSAAVAPVLPTEACSCTREPSASHREAENASCVCDRPVVRINACGLQCPGPIMKVKEAMDAAVPGQRVEVVATDAGFARDASAWCHTTGNRLIEKSESKGRYTVLLEKGNGVCEAENGGNGGRGKTLILFSDDLDKALATFVLANGAAATGQKVSIFFTFWGLNVLKKVNKPAVQKDIFGRMFGWMLPSSSLKLKLSQMNMLGMGSRMMRYLMKRKGVDSLESLRAQALAQGVEFIACQMSMDMMGIAREELLDEVTVGGVATYMDRADQANVNLFI